MKEKDMHKSVICKLAVAGSPDDGMLSVYTGCIDGNGKPDIAVIDMKCIVGIVNNEP